MSKTTTPEAAGPSFVAIFAHVASALVAEALREPLNKALSLVTVREGFPRGAAYTVHKSADKHANASAAIEPTVEGFDLILSNMVGSRAADAAGRLAVYVATALFPAVKAEGKAKANHRTAERNALLSALGLVRSKETGWNWNRPEWDALTGSMPTPRYNGSKEPINARVMLAFVVANADGTASKRKVYLSLTADGSDADEMRGYYLNGIKIIGPAKGDAYAPPVQQEAAA